MTKAVRPIMTPSKTCTMKRWNSSHFFSYVVRCYHTSDLASSYGSDSNFVYILSMRGNCVVLPAAGIAMVTPSLFGSEFTCVISTSLI